jgi:hypothetical protein
VTRPVVGVDPGGRTTGIVHREGNHLRRACVIRRFPHDPDHHYFAEVIGAIQEIYSPLVNAILAVEAVVPPTGQLGMVAVQGLIDTARLVGAITWEFPVAVLVLPGGHGAGPRVAYPPKLWGGLEKLGKGHLRHARAAWDIAAVAVLLDNVR